MHENYVLLYGGPISQNGLSQYVLYDESFRGSEEGREKLNDYSLFGNVTIPYPGTSACSEAPLYLRQESAERDCDRMHRNHRPMPVTKNNSNGVLPHNDGRNAMSPQV